MFSGRIAVLCLTIPLAAGAQQVAHDTARVASVVVTATRSPLAIERAPASVTVLTGAQLRSEGITTVVEALQQVPGLSLAQAGSYGSAASLFVRGGESKFTKVLIDGVPVNDAGGAFDFSTISTDDIDRIEIVRGPASVLYGSDAVAGVVQLFTRRGTSGNHGVLSARGGGYGSSDLQGSVRGARPLFDYSVGAAHHATSGFQAFNSNYRLDDANASLGFARNAADARLSLRYDDAAVHFPTDGSGLVVDSNAVRRDDRLSIGLDAGYRLAPAAEVRLALASHGVHGTTDDQPDSPGDTTGYYYTTNERSWRRGADLRLNLDLPRSTRLTLGGAMERERLETGTASNFGDTPDTSYARRTAGLYAQLLLAPAAQYTITLGTRWEHNQRFGDYATWRAAGSYQVLAGTHLHASAGTAFREPTFVENYGCCGFVQGNPGLSPEHSFSVDAGVEQALAAWGTVGAAVFANSFRDLIDYTPATGAPNYVNIARTRTRGVELDGRATLPAGMHADAAFTYLDARVVDPGIGTASASQFAADARLLRRPMHTFDAGLGVRRARAGADVRVLHVGTREDSYFAPDYSSSRVTLPAYTRTDVSGDVTIAQAASGRGAMVATLRVENAFDVRYSEIAGFNSDFSQGPEALTQTGYRAPGRRILGGLRLTF